MTMAGELAQFLVRTRYEDIPPIAIDYAAMLISSTVASAAMGFTLASSAAFGVPHLPILRMVPPQLGAPLVDSNSEGP